MPLKVFTINPANPQNPKNRVLTKKPAGFHQSGFQINQLCLILFTG